MEVELVPFRLKSLEQGDCSHNTKPADTRETVAPVRENSWTHAKLRCDEAIRAFTAILASQGNTVHTRGDDDEF